jgi:hypothetical protein
MVIIFTMRLLFVWTRWKNSHSGLKRFVYVINKWIILFDRFKQVSQLLFWSGTRQVHNISLSSCLQFKTIFSCIYFNIRTFTFWSCANFYTVQKNVQTSKAWFSYDLFFNSKLSRKKKVHVYNRYRKFDLDLRLRQN